MGGWNKCNHGTYSSFNCNYYLYRLFVKHQSIFWRYKLNVQLKCSQVCGEI